MCTPWPTCIEHTCVGVRIAGSQYCLRHASGEPRQTWFRTVGGGGPVDLRGLALDNALIGEVLVAPPRYGNGCSSYRVWRHLTMDGAQVSPGILVLDLSGDRFVGGVSMRSAVVERRLALRAVNTGDVDFRETRFLQGCDLRHARISGVARFEEVRGWIDAREATFNGPVDFRRASLDHLDLRGTMTRTLYLSLAEFGEFIHDPDVEAEGAKGSRKTSPVDLDGTPFWRPDLLESLWPAGTAWWVMIEEWVGFTERIGPDGGYRREGGVIGLAVSHWPVVDDRGRVAFPEIADEGHELAVDADGLAGVLQERLDDDERWPRSGDVFGITFRRGPMGLPTEEPISGSELAGLVTSVRDLTTEAREVARTAFLATLATAISELDAELTSADGPPDEAPPNVDPRPQAPA